MATPTRNYQLPLDARCEIIRMFTFKRSNFQSNLITISNVHPKHSHIDLKTYRELFLLKINPWVRVKIDWVATCRSLIASKASLNCSEAIRETCSRISKYVFPELGSRMVLRTENLTPSKWQRRYVAANILCIDISIVAAKDVNLFVRSNTLHLELPNDPYSFTHVGKQLKNPILWDQIFDDSQRRQLTTNSLKALSLSSEHSLSSPASTVVSKSPNNIVLTPSTSKANSVVSDATTTATVTEGDSNISTAQLQEIQQDLAAPPYTLLISQLNENLIKVESSHSLTIHMFHSHYKAVSTCSSLSRSTTSDSDVLYFARSSIQPKYNLVWAHVIWDLVRYSRSTSREHPCQEYLHC